MQNYDNEEKNMNSFQNLETEMNNDNHYKKGKKKSGREIINKKQKVEQKELIFKNNIKNTYIHKINNLITDTNNEVLVAKSEEEKKSLFE